MKLRPIVIVLTMGLLGCLAGTAAADPIPGGWTCSGNRRSWCPSDRGTWDGNEWLHPGYFGVFG